ncbi:Zn-finger domain associated with topoisomerase type I [Oligella urethralis]|nr:hypothetical protein [Oligella urethralis]SUA59859.1 Zn-finger domain associated with topoisomerase type I [Oligella urethralis]
MADFKLMAGDYSSKLLNGKEFAKYESKDEAEAIVNQLSGFSFGKVEDHKEVKKKNSPPLFHLTSLQQEANHPKGLGELQVSREDMSGWANRIVY